MNSKDFSESPSLYLVYRHILPNENGVLGWGTHVNSWLIHVNVWKKPLQYCKVISLHLIKINGKKNVFFRFERLYNYKQPSQPLHPHLIPVVILLHCSLSTFYHWGELFLLLSKHNLTNKMNKDIRKGTTSLLLDRSSWFSVLIIYFDS